MMTQEQEHGIKTRQWHDDLGTSDITLRFIIIACRYMLVEMLFFCHIGGENLPSPGRECDRWRLLE